MFVPEAGAALEHVDDGANHLHRNQMSVVNDSIFRHCTGDDGSAAASTNAIRSQQLVTGRIRFAASGQARSMRAAVVVE